MKVQSKKTMRLYLALGDGLKLCPEGKCFLAESFQNLVCSSVVTKVLVKRVF